MLFNSLEFIVFLLIVYVLYWFVLNKNLTVQNFFLLIASYVFYGWWDWRFLLLLILSTMIDYSFGLLIYRSKVQRTKKLLLWLSIFNNLAILGFFKYYNFFADSTRILFSQLGMELHPYMLDIALPVGISFYTFHGMSYVFDIYNDRAKPTTNLVNYSVFVCFFPLLVAGPIERCTHLLPQVEVKRLFSYKQSVDGLRLMLWGFFKKIVIADSLAQLVDTIFKSHEHSSGLSLMTGAVAFAIQIYGDFSGYTDIARGTAKLFGFELLINFRFPYFSRDIAEFWRRWHISLSSWFRDYLYIPLGGSRNGKWMAVRNTFIIFLVSGFWHGANWTYIFWGGLHAVYFLPLLLLNRNRKNNGPIAENSFLPSVMDFVNMVITFIIVCIAWVFFRASSISEAVNYLKEIVTNPLVNGQEKALLKPYLYMVVMLAIMFFVEWLCRNKDDVSSFFDKIRKRPVRYVVYALLCFMIIMYGAFEETSFIYFQF